MSYTEWLEQKLIATEPIWICDEMRDAGPGWCEANCEDMTSKCLKEYYRSIFLPKPKKDLPCATCKHKNEPWYSNACDGCCRANSRYEPFT